MRLRCQAMALILGDQAAKDPAAAAGPVTGSSSSSQDIVESFIKKKVGDSSLAYQFNSMHAPLQTL